MASTTAVQAFVLAHQDLINAVVMILLVWSLVWKGIALWKAARFAHKKWFVILLVANTVGILDIIYIYFVARKYRIVSETVEK